MNSLRPTPKPRQRESTAMNVSTDQLAPTLAQRLSMVERMLLIRRVEERLGADFKAGKLIAGVHLYSGQEAVGVGVCEHLDDNDWIASNHRGHGHFLAKGGEVRAMMAEIHAKATGVCKGMGGTMHVADLGKGILGANGIVGGGISLICGAAYSQMLQGQGQVAVAFFGDGASTQGVMSEALNLSALWKLPMIFVCENNLFSEFSRSDTVVAGRIMDRALAYGVPAVQIDGNDIDAVWRAAGQAVRRARTGEGPSFIEAFTYRMAGHVEAETGFLQGAQYRSSEEVQAWAARDPIQRACTRLLQMPLVTQAQLSEIEARVAAQVEDAVQFAHNSPLPPPEQALQFMFA
jgi:TPP-dependent pyruvate/acetoin dehydrogenase alpha subunit